MSNHITIELCEADRAMFGGLGTLLSTLIDRLSKHINISTPDQTKLLTDEEQAKLSAIVASAKTEESAKGAAETAQDATEAPTPTEDTPPWEEKPTAAENEPTPTVTLEQIQQKVVQLCAADGGTKKGMVREVINLYGTKVSDLKDQPEKWDEVWSKLTALEGKA